MAGKGPKKSSAHSRASKPPPPSATPEELERLLLDRLDRVVAGIEDDLGERITPAPLKELRGRFPPLDVAEWERTFRWLDTVLRDPLERVPPEKRKEWEEIAKTVRDRRRATMSDEQRAELRSTGAKLARFKEAYLRDKRVRSRASEKRKGREARTSSRFTSSSVHEKIDGGVVKNIERRPPTTPDEQQRRNADFEVQLPAEAQSEIVARAAALIENLQDDQAQRARAVQEVLGLVAMRIVQADVIRENLDAHVTQARALGATWRDVGRAAGMTAQAAHKRWATVDPKPARGRKRTKESPRSKGSGSKEFGV